MEKALFEGILSKEKIGELIAESASRWPIPDRFLRIIHMFVSRVCTGITETDPELDDLQKKAQLLYPHAPYYYVFHNGDYHFYHRKLPQDVCELREKVLFWINNSVEEYFSRGDKREKAPPNRALNMLRFLCLKENAGQLVDFSELYTHVWGRKDKLDREKILRDINSAQNELNYFVGERFIFDKSEKTEKDEVIIRRIHGMDKYEIGKGMPRECCIIKTFLFPE